MVALSFDPYKNYFSDDTRLDWWTCEAPETAWIRCESFAGPIDSKHMRAEIDFTDPKHQNVVVPISRCGAVRKMIRGARIVTVQDLLSSVANFYGQSVDQNWMDENRPGPADSNDFYHQAVLEKLRIGQTVTIMDLVGAPQTFGLDNGISTRRHIFACNGLVRYEGMEENALILGT